MRADSLSFVAQSLDNVSENVMVVSARLGPWRDELAARQDLMGRVNRITGAAAPRRAAAGRARAFVHAHEFVLEVVTEARDGVGRGAPILCYGYVGDTSAGVWFEWVASQLGAFGVENGLVTSEEVLGGAAQALRDALTPGQDLPRRLLKALTGR